MTNDYYKSKIMAVDQVEVKLQKARNLLCRNLLFASASLFGILVSLHHTTGTNLLCRLSFFLSLTLLGLGILTLAIALFLDRNLQSRLKKKRLDEVKQAISENREVNDVHAIANKVFVWSEIAGYICLLLSVIFLCAYEFFVSFPELFNKCTCTC